MAKVIDCIFASIIVLLLSFVFATLAFKNAIGALIFSCAFSLLIMISLHHFSKRNHKPYTYDRLETEFCIRGGEYVVDLLKSCLKNNKIENGGNYILLENSVIIANFKFSPLGGNDVASVCKLAKKHEKNHVYLIAKAVDRKAWQVANLQDIKMEIVKTKQVFKFLAKHDALPVLKKEKTKFSLSLLIGAILSRRNFKNYVFSGAVLLGASFLTPLKIYYIVSGTILLLLSLLALTPLGNGSLSTPKVFDELEKEDGKTNDENSEPTSQDGAPTDKDSESYNEDGKSNDNDGKSNDEGSESNDDGNSSTVKGDDKTQS